MHDQALWTRIKAHPLNAATGSAPYTVKLAQAEGWSEDYTLRVIEEYRRFLYLTQISKTPVTPPVAVDRAWHMHLTFTRDYWDVLCAEVLGKPLHHDPCEGEEEMPRYRAQFQATRALYLAEFGEAPPDDIWRFPSSRRGARLGISGLFVGSMLIPLPQMFGLHKSVMISGIVLLAVSFMIWVLSTTQRRGHANGGTGFAAGCGSGKKSGDGGAAGCGSGCGGGGCGGGGG